MKSRKSSIICVACNDTGINSKGGRCHPCEVNGRLPSSPQKKTKRKRKKGKL